MNKKALKDAIDTLVVDIKASNRKYEEEVTVDLNTTQTNQERGYKEFIKSEVKKEAQAFMKFALNHECRISVSLIVYLIPNMPYRLSLSFASYFIASLIHASVTVVRSRIFYQQGVSATDVVSMIEHVCVIAIILSDRDLYIKLLTPVYLVVSVFSLMLRCLSFSDTLDELFYVKMVDLYDDRRRRCQA